jgi:hypothetical protein
MGAQEVAVIELSVGTGLVTVLFVFAIAVAGEDAVSARSMIPRPVAWGLVIIVALILALLVTPSVEVAMPVGEPGFAEMVWQQRGLDVVLQVVMLFAGALGVLGLLGGDRAPAKRRAVQEEPVVEPAPRDDGRSASAPVQVGEVPAWRSRS